MNITKLPQLIQDTIEAFNKVQGVPLELSLPAILGAINFATHTRYDVKTAIYGVVPTSMYILAIAPTGALKSTIFKVLRKPIDEWWDSQRAQAKAIKEDYEIQMALYDKMLKKHINDPINNQKPNKPDDIATADYILDVATLNGVIDTLRQQPTVSFLSDEGGQFFNSHAFRGADGVEKASEISTGLTKLWGTGDISKTVQGDKHYLQDRRMSMLFLLQESVIRSFLGNQVIADQGFTHRLLISNCADFKKKQFKDTLIERRSGLASDLLFVPFQDRISVLLKKEFKYKMDGVITSLLYEDRKTLVHQLQNDVLDVTPDSEDLLAAYIDSNTGCALDKFQGFNARLHEHTLRIAATLAAFELKTVIDLETMEGAIEVMKFYVDQRNNLDIVVDVKNSDSVNVANSIYEWSKRTNKKTITKSELTQFGPISYKKLDKSERMKVIDLLIDNNQLEITEIDGKPYLQFLAA